MIFELYILMKKGITILIVTLVTSLHAQQTISGSFSPADDYNWLIAYQLKPGSQVYTADTAIKNGLFTLNMPQNTPEGTYRLVYAVPQEEYYFDVIYNGKEDIKLDFNIEQGVVFTESNENILFSTYFKEINAVERELIAFYSKEMSDISVFNQIIKKYHSVQQSYEKKSQNLLSNHFIKANRSYVPTSFESVQEFVKKRKESFFDHLDVNNLILQSSRFLTEKLTNYIFTALPLEELTPVKKEQILQNNIDEVVQNLDDSSDDYVFNFLEALWQQTWTQEFRATSAYILTKYLKTSPVAAKNQEIIDEIETQVRLGLGATAPEITWKKEQGLEKLSALNGSERYVLVFWSSTCGHCLKEVPALHEELSTYSDVKVVAVGLEDDDLNWKVESAKLDNFEHVIALGKWESDYAKLYDIHSTPTYFILDENKKIISKPESDKEVVNFLNEN